MSRHPLLTEVSRAAREEFLTDNRFARKARTVTEAAEVEQHARQVARWIAAAAAGEIDRGNLSGAFDSATLRKGIAEALRGKLGGWNSLNPMAKRALKKATTTAISAALAYLQARFPVLTLVNASSVSAALWGIADEI